MLLWLLIAAAVVIVVGGRALWVMGGAGCRCTGQGLVLGAVLGFIACFDAVVNGPNS